jgi:quercetin dioxygenase-like cupin family protein
MPINTDDRGSEHKEDVMAHKDQRWLFGKEVEGQPAGEGVVRFVKSYTDEVMVVENRFEKGAVGAMHSHPHTQITYVISGKFEFTIGEEKKVVTAGDTMLKKDGVPHGCVCLEEGILLDIFSPMREDFV